MWKKKKENAEVGKTVKANGMFEKFVTDIFLPKSTHAEKLGILQSRRCF